MAGHRPCRVCWGAAALIAVALAWWGWRGHTASEPKADQVAVALPAAAAPQPANRVPVVASQKSAEASDPAGSAPDLKRIFDDYIDSTDPRQRRVAVRAFEACVPAFLPATGQALSPEPLIGALPPLRRAEREVAYRALFARCHRLLAGGRAALDDTQQALQRDQQHQAPGLRAQEALLAGRFDRMEPLVVTALRDADPAAIESLAGIAVRILTWRQPDGADAATLQRARAVDAALPWVACDLGLDCNAQSLRALQLCAAEGLCEGDVTARLTARLSPGTVDPGDVQEQRSRLLGLIRSGRTLGLADLLP